ncbi:hypothetical protein F9C07_4255 [Aspergillus flavus]|uniref:Uncharacterized protein n=1 Tax=Aspergillus flavus (strain ATCC 200026 / FGSC A1120 / IAM 13836 / NRRL 3357 / JCM 12722 / SRRC 167) TaxID=332952 RepID=A0A7U2QWC1_ASPFN|nr:hypothetical protein F9C07_4255 [Aspergillus flavus]
MTDGWCNRTAIDYKPRMTSTVLASLLEGEWLWIRVGRRARHGWCQQLQELRAVVPWPGQRTCPNGLWSSRWIDAILIAITIGPFRESPT